MNYFYSKVLADGGPIKTGVQGARLVFSTMNYGDTELSER